MNPILKSCLYYGASRVEELPFFRASFAARAVIIMFHEIQRDCQSELMTGTSVSLFEYSLNWLRREGWSIVLAVARSGAVNDDPCVVSLRASAIERNRSLAAKFLE